MKKTPKNTSMFVRVEKRFLSPLTGKLTKVGDEFNVPQNQFWFKRVMKKDCARIKSKSRKQETASVEKESARKHVKGSK